jgi:uncharacterized protein (DUF2141 family)
MKGCTYRSRVIMAALLTVVLSCARQAAPSGGPKDVTPPKIVKSSPPSSSLNFKGKSVVITFNEFVALDKVSEKFMVSPPVKKKPDIILKGKNVEVKFFEKLKDNTTYTLYFQDAIRDLNEGNPISDFQFVFSTGNVLDSLSVTGNVYNAFNLESPENAIILMHRQLEDSAAVKMLPDYITLADINGGFRINNTSAGTYRLYALQDKNNNKRYDLADEGFAFMDNPVEITTEKNYLPAPVVKKDTAKTRLVIKKNPEVPLIDGEFRMYLFTAANKKHFLTSSSRKSANLLGYTLSLPPDTVKFKFDIQGADNKGYFIEKSSKGDSIYVWLTDSLLSSKPLISTLVSYPFTDSTGVTKSKTDTIAMRFTVPRAPRIKDTKNKYFVTTNLAMFNISPGSNISFLSETPFRAPDTSKIHLYETEKTKKTIVPYNLIKDSTTSRRYFMVAKLKEGTNYQFIADKGSFGNIFGNSTDSTGYKFLVRYTDSYGKLTLNITGITGNTIIQLLDTKEKVLSEKLITKNEKIELPLLEKGKYRLKAIYDLNGDGIWTPGDFKAKRQPEPVSYNPEEIEIRADFQIDQDWDLSKRNLKDQKLRTKMEPRK